MKTTSIKLLLLILIFNFSSCKKGVTSTFSDYQFEDQKQVINCTNADSKLLNDALYSFEKDISAYFDKQQQSVSRAYSAFTRQATSRKVPYDKFASKHSVALADALKAAGIINDTGVNYNSDVITCIADNMKEGGLKTTFNALLSTNSMRKELFGEPLKTAAGKIPTDKYLGTYLALEYYYAELLNVDFSKVDFNRPEVVKKDSSNPVLNSKPDNGKVDFNKRPKK